MPPIFKQSKHRIGQSANASLQAVAIFNQSRNVAGDSKMGRGYLRRLKLRQFMVRLNDQVEVVEMHEALSESSGHPGVNFGENLATHPEHSGCHFNCTRGGLPA
jgi:hypothetical protein